MTLPQPTPDDLDRAFSQFFRAQMPARWPAPPIPAQGAVPAPVRGGAWRNRLTLAASVAAVLALGFAVTYGPSVGPPTKPNGNGIDPSTVVGDGKGLKKHMDDTPPMKLMP
jgi:hypothetical protein